MVDIVNKIWDVEYNPNLKINERKKQEYQFMKILVNEVIKELENRWKI